MRSLMAIKRNKKNNLKKGDIVYITERSNQELAISPEIKETSNLKEIIMMDEVDKTKTNSNDPHQLEKVFGIEAARLCIIRETMDTLREAGLTVDIRHVMMISDTMTIDGKVKPIGRHGVSGDKGSVLARASFEETVKHLLDAATSGERDTLTGVVENVIVGQLVSVGTGLPKLVMKEK